MATEKAKKLQITSKKEDIDAYLIYGYIQLQNHMI